MRDTGSGSRSRTAAKLAGVLFTIAFAAGGGIALAVSEVDIGSSSGQFSTSESAPASPPEAPAPGPERSSNFPGLAPRVQPHATFPYTIRAGDTLGSIAGLFGIPIADLARVNHFSNETELVIGQTIRIPNPAIAQERALTEEVDRLTNDKQRAEEAAQQSAAALASARTHLSELSAEVRQSSRDLRWLGWWRTSAYVLGVVAVLMLGAMVLALAEWWLLRNRFRAVAEMNESLRRLDHKYKTALAKAELRLQELYGRRRRGIHDGQERPKLAEEAEIEVLNRELKAVLEHHLERLGPAGAGARRARWDARVNRIGSAVEIRPIRR
jgi:LysM repeat protein